MIEQVLKALAVVLGFTAIYLFYTDKGSDYTFAAVVLAISAAFLSYRFRIKQRMDRRQAERAGHLSEDRLR